MDFSNESDYEDCEVKLDSQIFTKLTEVVRGQYFQFLERQLHENLCTWQEQCQEPRGRDFLEASIHECAKMLEDLAIKEAILAQLYQRAMVKTIAIVKKSTKDKILVEQLAQFLKSNEQRTASKATSTQIVDYATKAIQTEDLINVSEPKAALSLDDRIDLFQAQLQKGHINNLRINNPKPYVHTEKQNSKRRRLNRHQRHNRLEPLSSPSAPLILHSPTPPPLPVVNPVLNAINQKQIDFDVQLEDDEIAQEMEKIFTEQETDLDEIFGIVPRAQSSCDMRNGTKYEVTPNVHVQNNNETHHQGAPEKMLVTATTTTKTSTSNSNEQIFPEPVKDLRYSLWPCEAFMQKQKLSATLNRLIEEDIRWHDILKWQFSVLFNDESSDDFSLCSPSIELDDVLISSCMRRISPWVVRHLMKPLKDGLIGNRFLFKKLAKKLAHHIIMENQYPGEYVIKSVIENYFCIHRAIMTAEDLDDIKIVPIGNFD